MGDLNFPWYSRGYPEPEGLGGYGSGVQNPPAVPAEPVAQQTKKPKPAQTAPSIDNSARTASNARPQMPGKQMPGGTPEWYGRATQQMPPQFTPPPGVGLQPPRPDAAERRRWLR